MARVRLRSGQMMAVATIRRATALVGSRVSLLARHARFPGLSQSGAKRARTADLLGAIQALSQLSYGPVWLRL